MPSPFPGMDPWLESPEIFPDLHSSLISLLREAINARLPEGYFAASNYRVWIEKGQIREPDVGVFAGHNGHSRRHRPSGPSVAELSVQQGLMVLSADGDEEGTIESVFEETYLEIRSVGDRRLVTALEVLSPSNKSGQGRIAYREKQAEYLAGGAYLVEIDLLRGGTHTTLAPIDRLRALANCDYHICISVPGELQKLVTPIGLAENLPAVVVPLDEAFRAVRIELKPLLDRAYDTGRYPLRVRYDEKPVPTLKLPQATWAAEILKERGRTA